MSDVAARLYQPDMELIMEQFGSRKALGVPVTELME